MNLQPGLFLVTFAGSSSTCTSDGGLYGAAYPGFLDAGTGTIVPVVPGFLTTPVAASCR